MLLNSSLMRESRALSFVSRLIDNSNIPEGTLRKNQLHSNVSMRVVARLGVASKQTNKPGASWRFSKSSTTLATRRWMHD
jgi:hypothetical protein